MAKQGDTARRLHTDAILSEVPSCAAEAHRSDKRYYYLFICRFASIGVCVNEKYSRQHFNDFERKTEPKLRFPSGADEGT